MTSTGPIHYRIHEALYEDGLHLKAWAYTVHKETPQGYWVANKYVPTWLAFPEMRKRGYLHWVSKTSRIRYCYPTLKEALASYKRRKERQIFHAEISRKKAEKALEGIQQFLNTDPYPLIKGLCVGKLEDQEIDWSFE